MNRVCASHHEPVNAKGKGCVSCLHERQVAEARRRARREAAREAQAAKRAR